MCRGRALPARAGDPPPHASRAAAAVPPRAPPTSGAACATPCAAKTCPATATATACTHTMHRTALRRGKPLLGFRPGFLGSDAGRASHGRVIRSGGANRTPNNHSTSFARRDHKRHGSPLIRARSGNALPRRGKPTRRREVGGYVTTDTHARDDNSPALVVRPPSHDPPNICSGAQSYRLRSLRSRELER